MRGYCENCMEIRTDTFDDIWGFAFVASVPQCLRCGSIVELKENGQSGHELEENDGEDEAGLAG